MVLPGVCMCAAEVTYPRRSVDPVLQATLGDICDHSSSRRHAVTRSAPTRSQIQCSGAGDGSHGAAQTAAARRPRRGRRRRQRRVARLQRPQPVQASGEAALTGQRPCLGCGNEGSTGSGDGRCWRCRSRCAWRSRRGSGGDIIQQQLHERTARALPNAGNKNGTP